MTIDTSPERLRHSAHDMIDNGHPWAAALMHAAAARIEELEQIQAPPGERLERLCQVIRNAIPHQTNHEVRRWLQAALDDIHPIYDNTGRRIDAR